MLKHLHISNYAIIQELDVAFEKGYTVITGETGSGKSILIGSLNLIAGVRSDTKIIRDKNKKCVVEAVFDISNYDLKEFFDKNDLDYSEETIIRREILPTGRTRSFINDTPVNLNILRELSSFLFDIHSQHSNILLNDTAFQMNVLDVFAGNNNILTEYQTIFKQYGKLRQELENIKTLAKKEQQDLDYYQFQYDQLEKASLKNETEQEELEELQRQLSHIEEIKQNLTFISQALNNEDVSVISLLQQAKNAASQITDFYPKAAEFLQRLENALIDLQDLAHEIEIENSELELDPQQLEAVNQRLDLIYSLEHKFGVSSVKELIKIREDLQDKLFEVNTYDEKIQTLQKQLDELEKQLEQLAEKLSQNRKAVKQKFEKQIETLLIKLGIPNATFYVKLEPVGNFTQTGKNKVAFYFSANKNMEPLPLSKVASGGELSRVMLALKYIVSKKKTLPTLIFDEIDTGISGRIAAQTGEMIKEMAKKIQVIQITHSPQIAAKADNHFVVYKKDTQQGTFAFIEKLDKQKRIEEIAKMISGQEITKASLDAAKDLLG